MVFFFKITSQSSAIFSANQNQSEYINFLLKKRFEDNKKKNSCEKMRNLGNCIYEYAHSFCGDYF